MKTFTLVLLFAVLSYSTAHAQYCMLPGRTPYANVQPGITEFKLNTVDRTSSNVENMSSVVVETHDTTYLAQGHTYTVTIKHSEDHTNFPGARNNIRVWIDYNGNKLFTDANETAVDSDFVPAGTFTHTFTVPTTATLGYTMLRATAKMSSDAGHSTPTVCDTPSDPLGYHGEMEDYVIKIISPTTVPNTIMNSNEVLVYPNPSNGSISLLFNSKSHQPLSIDLIDIAGKTVGNLLTTAEQATFEYQFNLKSVTNISGMYYLRISTPENACYRKVTILN